MILRPMNQQQLRNLVDTAAFVRPADKWIKNATYLNVYTGRIETGNIAIARDRIAYVGPKTPKVDDFTEIIDGTGHLLAPGYIEPHAHPYLLYSLGPLASYAIQTGTTAMISDSFLYLFDMDPDRHEQFLNEFSESPMKVLWWSRHGDDPAKKARFPAEQAQRVLAHPRVIQAGELTNGFGLLHGEDELLTTLLLAKQLGKRVEGHFPGASLETLNAMAAAGVTACHEAINREEVLNRLRLGYYAALRHSSIRPDLPVLIRGLLEEGLEASPRLMLTTDGTTPPFMEKGFMDYLLKLVMDEGVEPATAYRMATLNPAVYYGLDAEIGGIAPGRLADILFLEDLQHPTPDKVMANGEWVAERGAVLQPERFRIDWTKYLNAASKFSADWTALPEWFDINPDDPQASFPVASLMNAVITLQEDVQLPLDGGRLTLAGNTEGMLYIALVDRSGTRVTNGVIKGFAKELEALATTFNDSRQILVIGSSPDQMAEAVNELNRRDGGVLLRDGGETRFFLALPLWGQSTDQPFEYLIKETIELVHILRDKGYEHEDPLMTLLFLSAVHLPKLRFTPEGVYSVRKREVVHPSRSTT